MMQVHGIENPVLITLAEARAAVAREEEAAAAALLPARPARPALPALPAAVPSSSPPSSTPSDSVGPLLQLLQQNLGDPRTMEALKHFLSVPAASPTARSNDALTGGSGALPGPSSSSDDPVFSPRAPRTGRKSLVIDWTSDDDAKASPRRPMPNAVAPSSSAASSSTNLTTTEPRIRTVRLAQSSDQARSAKRARRTSGDLTSVSNATDINNRFLNIQPALDRLNEIFMRGNAVIITEDRIAAPEDGEQRSDTLMRLDVSGAYTKVTADHIERWEEMNKSTSKGKGKARAQTTVEYERDGSMGGASQGFHHPLWKLAKGRREVIRCDEAGSADGGNNSNDGGAGDEGDKGDKGDDGNDSDWESV